MCLRGKLITIILCLIIAAAGCSSRQKTNDHINKVTAKVSNSDTLKVTNESTYKRDLDNDGVEEMIKFTFYETQDSNIHEQYYTITITSGPKHYTYKSDNDNNISNYVHFADFDTKDKSVEFYINSEGPSDDPSSSIYRFDKKGIRKVCITAGYVTEYDREGKIYTDYSKTHDKYGVLLSYYDIRKGSLVFAEKHSLIGKKLQFDNSLILFTDSADKKWHCESYVNDNQGMEEINKRLAGLDKENVAKICRPNEELIITDIDSTYHGMFKVGNPKNIRIKVKTPDGKEGWLDWLNGGD